MRAVVITQGKTHTHTIYDLQKSVVPDIKFTAFLESLVPLPQISLSTHTLTSHRCCNFVFHSRPLATVKAVTSRLHIPEVLISAFSSFFTFSLTLYHHTLALLFLPTSL